MDVIDPTRGGGATGGGGGGGGGGASITTFSVCGEGRGVTVPGVRGKLA